MTNWVSRDREMGRHKHIVGDILDPETGEPDEGGAFNGGTITDPLVIEPTGLGEDSVIPLVVQGTPDSSTGYEVVRVTDEDQIDLFKVLGDGSTLFVVYHPGSAFTIRNASAHRLLNVRDGLLSFRLNAAPADISLGAGECALWLDPTPGATKLMIKAKDSGGTVRTGQVALT